MKHGVLVYDKRQERMDARFGAESRYGGLHCGETLKVRWGGEWIPTLIEMADDWYLFGVKTDNLAGLTVQD
jgi:hypothetical protein